MNGQTLTIKVDGPPEFMRIHNPLWDLFKGEPGGENIECKLPYKLFLGPPKNLLFDTPC